MRQYLAVLSATALGFVGGMLFSRRSRRVIPNEPEIEPPLEQAEYEKRLEYNDRLYHEAMAQYDRLVPWAAGGGLVASLTLIGSFAQLAAPWTKWILGLAWLLLVCALLCSILSQYSSTRIQVWAKAALKSRQHPPAAGAQASVIDEWRQNTLDFQRRSGSRGQITKLLNVWAALLLVAGLLTLGVFSISAVPFGKQIGSQPNPALEPSAPTLR